MKLLDVYDYDFLANMFSASENKTIRKRMVESILSTDMAQMKQLRDDFQLHLNQFGI